MYCEVVNNTSIILSLTCDLRVSHSVLFWSLSSWRVVIISWDLVCSCSYCSDNVVYWSWRLWYAYHNNKPWHYGILIYIRYVFMYCIIKENLHLKCILCIVVISLGIWPFHSNVSYIYCTHSCRDFKNIWWSIYVTRIK